MAVDLFLKLEGVTGESKDEKHADEIELMSFSFGESNPSSIGGSGGLGGGQVSMSDFNVMKSMDKSSPEIFKRCANGSHFPTAIITYRKAGGEQLEYLKYKFEKVFITSYTVSGSGADVPTESISMAFEKLEYAYSPQKPEGDLDAEITTSYDIKTRKCT